MALIKKYNTGGSFKEYLKEDLLKNAGSVEVPKEIFERQGTIDPNDESTLEGLSSKGRDYIHNLNSKYKKKSEDVSFTNFQLDDKIIRDSDFLKVLKDEFGSLEGIYNHYEKNFLDSGGNDAIKQDLTTRLKNLSDSYFQEHTANPHDNWIRLKEFQNLQQALNIGNWDDIADKSRKLGWNLDSLLFSDDRLKQRQAEKDRERQQAEINTKLQDLQNIGFSPEMAGELLRQGYRPYDNQHFSDYGFMDNLKSLGYNLISNVDNSAHFLTKDGQLVNNYGDWISKDILNKYYGYSIGSNDQGAFRIYKPEEHELNTNVELWEDYADKKIKLTPGEGNDTRFSYHDWYGTSGDDLQQNFHKNTLGLRNLLGQITRVDRRTGQENVYTLNDKGEYLDLKGNKAEVPTWGSYTDEGLVRHSLDKYFKKNKNSPLYGITGKVMTKPAARGIVPQNTEQAQQMIDEVEAEVERIQEAGDTKTKNKYRKNLSDAARHIFYLAEKAEKEGNFDNFDIYHKLLLKVADIMEAVKPEEEGGEGIPIMRGTTFNKEGGVLKAQSGSVLEELYKRSTQKSSQAPSVSDFNQGKINPGKVKFLNKTMSEMDALDTASMIGNVASIIPVIGGFGAAATTAIDIARGLKKDGAKGWEKEDTLNLLSNLGFTALSFAGLGGARALKVGAQAAKGSGRFAKLAKSAKGAVKIKPVAFGEQVARGADKMSRTSKAIRKSDDFARLVDLAKGADTIGDIAKAGVKADDLRLLQQIAGRRHNWVQSAGIAGAKGVTKGAQKVGDLISNPGVGKWVGRGVKAGIGYQGVMGGLNVGKNIAEADGNIFQKIGTGIGNTEQSDIKNILFASGLGVNQAKSAFRTHAAKRNIKPIEGSGTKATTTLKIGGQKFELNKTAEKGKALKSLKPKDLKNALTKKESKKLLESLTVEDLAKPEQAKEFKKILDALKPTKEGAKVKVPKVTLSQNNPKGFKYELSEHALDSGGQKSYGWWDNVLHKSASKSWDKGLSGHYGKTYKWDKSGFKENVDNTKPKPKSNPESSYYIKKFNKAKSGNFGLDKFKKTTKPGQVKSTWNRSPNKPVNDLIGERNKVRNTFKGIDKNSPLYGTRTSQIRNNNFSSKHLSKAFKEEYLKTHKTLPDKIKYTDLKNTSKELKELFRNDAFKILSKRGRTLKKGGILKAANGLTLPSYIAPMSERRLRGIGEPFKWEKNFTINPQTSTNKYNLGLNTNANTPLYNTFRSTYDRNMEQPVVNPEEERVASYEDFKAQDFDPYKDRSQLAKLFGETIKFANTWNTNQNVYQNRIRALNEKAFKMNTMPYTHLRSPGQFNYVNAINTGNQMLDNVKGITSSSADIDKNAAYKIQTAGQLMKYYNQALAQDNQALYNHDNMVQQMRDEVQRQNLGIDTQQKQLWADARSGMHLEGSNKDMQQGNNINTWIGELMNINSQRPTIKSRENYINAVLDPNTLNFSNWLYDLETTKLAEEQKLHKEEEEQRKAFGPTTYQEMKWEDSNRYKIWQEQVIAARRRLQAMQTLFANRQQLASMLAPTTTEKKQKGGRIPLHEKIALENVRHRNRLTRQTEKEYYKQLLENNKLVQKAMVKVFK